MSTTSAHKDWNPRWPGCLVGLEDRAKALQAVRDRVTTAHVEALGVTWKFLVNSTVKMDDLLQGKNPPDSQPGDYELGPVLPVLWYDRVSREGPDHGAFLRAGRSGRGVGEDHDFLSGGPRPDCRSPGVPPFSEPPDEAAGVPAGPVGQGRAG
jgi:hypothetical protein